MKSNKYRLIISLITLFIFLFTTIGFATYNKNLTASGSVYFKKNGEIAITSVHLTDNSNLQNPTDPTFTKDSISFDLTFDVASASNLDDDYYAEYTITLSNASFYNYEFASSIFTPSVETNNNQNMNISYDLSGITLGEIIPPLTTKTFTLRISMYPQSPGTYNVTGESGVDTEQQPPEQTGSLLASIPNNSSVNVRGSTVRDKVVMTVINSYDTAKNFTLSINNSNFKLVDSGGNDLGNMTILANTTQTYDVYIERKSGVKFAVDQVVVNLSFNNGTTNSHLGNVTVLVDKDQTLLDDKPPLISNVNATFVAQNGIVNLAWNATDVSGIDHFVIEAVNSDNGNVVQTYTTTNSSTNYQTTGLTNGTYYFRIYGIDTKNISGSSYVSSCDTTEGYCSRSTAATYTWTFDVTYNLTNLSVASNVSRTATIGEQYTGRIQANNNYSLPNSITITMNGQRLTSGYTYSNNNGNITINNVTGPITIEASGTGGGGICLVEGTKIRLADGKEKNIENIDYTDLLKVWSYETGKITYEYPIWIEKSNESAEYQKTTFSDGTILKTVGLHQVFSLDENKFVNIIEDGNFIKVGTSVAKIVNDRIVPVKVTKVETIYEKVKYYYVASSIYYNVISDNILTTSDQITKGVTLSNMYGFDKNIKWPNSRKDIISKPGALYEYEDLSVMPYYLYLGSRGNETKLFVNSGYATTEGLVEYLLRTQLNPYKVVSPNTNKNGKRMWMVTTSEDIVMNKKDFLYEEGSYYTLPNIIGVKKWYSTFENKYYKPFDKVKVDFPMHFIAK